MKVSIITLGCKVNQAESASIEGELREKGNEIVSFSNNPGTNRNRPDACIINTCTVTAKSDYQSRQMIRRAVRSGAKVIATGCYAQLRPEELSGIEGIDLVLGNSEKGNIAEHLHRIMTSNVSGRERGCTSPTVCIKHPDTPMHLKTHYSNRSRAFLKIQDGCNFSCSYCTVPRARGKSRSLGHEDLLCAVDTFSQDGYREIILSGIHIGSYGSDLQPKSTLLKIVKEITRAYPHIRFRLSSLDPREFRGEFLSLMKDGHICPHLHIPLQSGSDRMLKTMKRRYNTSFYENLINSIAADYPGISIGTDIIIGFPGESDDDFNSTAKLLERLPLSYIHVFPFSKRPDTVAADMKGQVRDEIKKNRVKRTLEIAQSKKNKYLRSHLAKELNVIVEEKLTSDGYYRGISDNYIRPFIRTSNLKLGQTVRVKAVSFVDGNLMSIPSEERRNIK
jgi:threonylcarbamoyladenosine tRNA methylthiotransferase MtaB